MGSERVPSEHHLVPTGSRAAQGPRVRLPTVGGSCFRARGARAALPEVTSGGNLCPEREGGLGTMARPRLGSLGSEPVSAELLAPLSALSPSPDPRVLTPGEHPVSQRRLQSHLHKPRQGHFIS